MKKLLIVLFTGIFILGSFGGTSVSAEETAAETKAAEEKFVYQHDPTENAIAMKDILVNPDAIYGFSPDPESERLGVFADIDWTDEKTVEECRQERLAYHKSLDELYELLKNMRAEGKTIEEMARTVSAERNRIRLDSYKNDPEGLVRVKQSNLETYGNENGPTADFLFEKYGSWEIVIAKAFGTNPGMDACLGLYDDYYTLYEELGLIGQEEESTEEAFGEESTEIETALAA